MKRYTIIPDSPRILYSNKDDNLEAVCDPEPVNFGTFDTRVSLRAFISCSYMVGHRQPTATVSYMV
jgi:hypothetical protein